MGYRRLAAAIAVMAVVTLTPVDAGGQTQADGTSGGATLRIAWGDPRPAGALDERHDDPAGAP